jgi:hypothetical protein
VADQMVIEAQKFINSYNVAGIPKVEEDGRTGWAVMFALNRALQSSSPLPSAKRKQWVDTPS